MRINGVALVSRPSSSKSGYVCLLIKTDIFISNPLKQLKEFSVHR